MTGEGEDLEARRRGQRAGRDSNATLDALRLLRDRLERWAIDGARPSEAYLLASAQALQRVLAEPRLSDDEVELLADEVATGAEFLGRDPVVDLDFATDLLWLGGRQLEPGEEA